MAPPLEQHLWHGHFLKRPKLWAMWTVWILISKDALWFREEAWVTTTNGSEKEGVGSTLLRVTRTFVRWVTSRRSTNIFFWHCASHSSCLCSSVDGQWYHDGESIGVWVCTLGFFGWFDLVLATLEEEKLGCMCVCAALD